MIFHCLIPCLKKKTQTPQSTPRPRHAKRAEPQQTPSALEEQRERNKKRAREEQKSRAEEARSVRSDTGDEEARSTATPSFRDSSAKVRITHMEQGVTKKIGACDHSTVLTKLMLPAPRNDPNSKSHNSVLMVAGILNGIFCLPNNTNLAKIDTLPRSIVTFVKQHPRFKMQDFEALIQSFFGETNRYTKGFKYLGWDYEVDDSRNAVLQHYAKLHKGGTQVDETHLNPEWMTERRAHYLRIEYEDAERLLIKNPDNATQGMWAEQNERRLQEEIALNGAMMYRCAGTGANSATILSLEMHFDLLSFIKGVNCYARMVPNIRETTMSGFQTTFKKEGRENPEETFIIPVHIADTSLIDAGYLMDEHPESIEEFVEFNRNLGRVMDCLDTFLCKTAPDWFKTEYPNLPIFKPRFMLQHFLVGSGPKHWALKGVSNAVLRPNKAPRRPYIRTFGLWIEGYRKTLKYVSDLLDKGMTGFVDAKVFYPGVYAKSSGWTTYDASFSTAFESMYKLFEAVNMYQDEKITDTKATEKETPEEEKTVSPGLVEETDTDFKTCLALYDAHVEQLSASLTRSAKMLAYAAKIVESKTQNDEYYDTAQEALQTARNDRETARNDRENG